MSRSNLVDGFQQKKEEYGPDPRLRERKLAVAINHVRVTDRQYLPHHAIYQIAFSFLF